MLKDRLPKKAREFFECPDLRDAQFKAGEQPGSWVLCQGVRQRPDGTTIRCGVRVRFNEGTRRFLLWKRDAVEMHVQDTDRAACTKE
jgi:hypothetical protein